MNRFLLFSLLVGIVKSVIASPIPASDPSIVGWATGYEDLIRGPIDISDPGKGTALFGDPNDVIGPAGADGGVHPVVSLGDGGSIVLSFTTPITNGAGSDFAVFENSHSTFFELAFVEVSSDGLNFFRFDAISLTQTETQIGSFGTIDPADITNLAGKDLAGNGTPFDLEELVGIPGLNVNAITHVKIIDVVGSIDSAYARYDSLGNIINEPWKTDFVEGNGGFDLDAVGVLNAIPEPSVLFLLVVGIGLVIRHAHRQR
ncbi:MAG: PEP-CTERM sorting domain-containing protein [Kiritimatiellae bacterium]|jgi:hypothetical protein|nr:PEP-CTERM sorting domain-containing protein [Kiritimatiellia bacterium]